MKFNVLNRWTGKIQADRLRELFFYDPETGIFTYRTRAARRVRIGGIAGSVNDQGYRHIRVDGRAYKAHRLAWLYATGLWPTGMIDHINGERDDNRFGNLREASHSENLANSRVFRGRKAARKGVRQVPNGKWIARIQKDNRPIFLGYFETLSEASAAYRHAAHEFFGDFARA